jgi:hypothetical protein
MTTTAAAVSTASRADIFRTAGRGCLKTFNVCSDAGELTSTRALRQDRPRMASSAGSPLGRQPAIAARISV